LYLDPTFLSTTFLRDWLFKFLSHNVVMNKTEQDRLVTNPRRLKEKINTACHDNPDLPRSFVRASLIALGESKNNSTEFVPRSTKNS
jgi:hypothetical protein